MTDTTAATGLTVQQWDDKFFVEHLKQNRFASEMGTSENAIIQVKEDLTKKKGDSVTFALVNRLTGAGVTNGATLEGNEEDLDSRSFKLTVGERAHAVRVTDWQNQISAIDLRNAAKTTLKVWSTTNTRDRTIQTLMSINGIAYASASAAQRNTWMTNNVDRVLFGASKSNKKATHALSLTEIDATTDKFTAAAASLMKRIAATADPKIMPVMMESNGREYYVCYVPSLVFRDLKTDPVITQAQRDVSLSKQNEKLFKGGDIEWDGIIFKEIHDIPVVTGAGAGGTVDVAPVFFCGAQALGYGVANRWRSAEEVFDYGRKKGVAIMEMGGIEKLRFGSGVGDLTTPKDHGLVTGWFAAVADA